LEDAVLDSDALIEAYDMGVEKFSGVHTTYISLYEFLRGLAYLGKSTVEYKSYLESSLEVLPLDNKAVLLASNVYAGLIKKGTLVEDPDLLIACICIANKLPIVTGNTRHYERFREFGLLVRAKAKFMAAARAG
jgi:predicted nucleic acid-binding protein